MHIFDYTNYAVTLTDESGKNWKYSVKTPTGKTLPSGETFPSDTKAAAAARKWIDEHRLNPDAVFESALVDMEQTEAAKLRAATAASDGQKSLDKLFDYTKFHIGLYLTLTSTYVGITSLKTADSKRFLFTVDSGWFWLAVSCFIAAGIAGGVIASSITQTNTRSSESFLTECIGPWKWRPLSARGWTWIEHTSFWSGLFCALVSIRFST